MNNEESTEVLSLIDMAKIASENAYSPYSNIKVGAAVQCKNGKIFTGCNVENGSYGGTICAERVAISKAVSENEREFTVIAIYVQSNKLFPPCGICRQFMAEFSKDMTIFYGNEKEIKISNIDTLLPDSFVL